MTDSRSCQTVKQYLQYIVTDHRKDILAMRADGMVKSVNRLRNTKGAQILCHENKDLT